MIEIKNKKDCVGCGACSQKCPKQCIDMNPDDEGFLYPIVNVDLCIKCGLCEKVCPVINESTPRRPLKVLAAINTNKQIRLDSSSGGIFSILAETVINEGGICFGAKFDDTWSVVHDCANVYSDLNAFRGSKYVQSKIGNAYKSAEYFLKKGRKVLFSGTPCQIRGLKLFLQKEYDNLITVDFICHGVPSDKFWKKYLKEEIEHHIGKSLTYSSVDSNDYFKTLKSVKFREKGLEWNKFRMVLTFTELPTLYYLHYKNPYFYCFLNAVSERYSCYSCPVKEFRSGSDITLADFWGFENDSIIKDKKNGVSLVILHRQENEICQLLKNAICEEVNWDKVKNLNPIWERSIRKDVLRDSFYKEIEKVSVKRYFKKLYIRNKIKRYANRIIDFAFRNRLR